MIVPIHSIKTPLAPLSLNLMPVTLRVGMHRRACTYHDFFPSSTPGLHSHAERGNEGLMRIHEFRDTVGLGRNPAQRLPPWIPAFAGMTI
jgi:hypothetical protein